MRSITPIAPADVGFDWLPAPAIRTVQPARPVTKASETLWVYPQRNTPCEKVLMGLLGLAAVIGIAYGFSCLLDLVHNWGAVCAGIRQMI
jgi:hypothetical protein